jgi:hypothetical protein
MEDLIESIPGALAWAWGALFFCMVGYDGFFAALPQASLAF